MLIFSALGVWTALANSAWLHSSAVLETGLAVLVQLSPTLLIVLAFTFIYLFMPNTRVKPLAAFGGA
ncbi:hypothetical protein [Thiothrix subterranea]|uniref:hypothetical protein n=1 Tax=Thiothrix subterranea TaxID=2735563 RepID=UPI00280B5416|nr:hypothetical protein [Thiothrix subterranea]